MADRAVEDEPECWAKRPAEHATKPNTTMIADRIQSETIAETMLLATRAEGWPEGPQKEVALDLATVVTNWRRDAAGREMEPILEATHSAPATQRPVLKRIVELFLRMVLEHGVEAGMFGRGPDPDTYQAIK